MRRVIMALLFAELASLTNAHKLVLTKVSPAGDEDEVTEVVETIDAGETIPVVDQEVIDYAESEGIDTEQAKDDYLNQFEEVCLTADGATYNATAQDPEQPVPELYCYTELQVNQSLTYGYWYEMCNEINQAAITSCGDDDPVVSVECFSDNMIYFAQMYQSMPLYLALMYYEAYRDEIYLLCYENYDLEWYVSQEFFDAGLNATTIEDLYDDSDWNYRIADEAIDIKGKITYDMELYFTVNQARGIYNIDAPEYLAICQAASGLYEPFTRDAYEDQQDFELAIASIISQLESFDYLSEDEDALYNLYFVCVHNNSLQITLGDEEQLLNAESLEEAVVKTTNSNVFLELYPEFDDFQSLYT